MRRHFQVVDCTRHLGLPIVLACIVLSLTTGALNCFALYFLPVTWNYILMCYAGVTAFVGALAALTGFRFLTAIYLLAESLCRIPVGVVIGFSSWVLANYYTKCDRITWDACLAWYTEYEWRLFDMDYGFLIAGDCVACLSFILAFTTLAGFRKLRLHQSGVATAVDTRGHHHHNHVDAVFVEERHHHHHHPPPAVVTVAQPTAMTMQQPAIVAVPAQNVIVQPSAPTLYPQLQANTYTVQTY